MELTPSQKVAAAGFFKFLADPDQRVMCLIGYAGCGKSTLVKYLIEKMPERVKMLNLLTQFGEDPFSVRLTATTNKATSVLADLNVDHWSIQSVTTIHSLLGLVVRPDFKTGKQYLVQSKGGCKLEPGREVIFVDEGSFVNQELLDSILNSVGAEKKIVFVLDEFQLAPPGENGVRPAVAGAGYPEYRLEEVMRNQGAIEALSAQFRESVKTGQFKRIVDNGQDIVWCDGPRFQQEIRNHFSDPTEASKHRILAWRNATVQQYNNFVRANLQGFTDPNEIHVGEFLIANDIIRDVPVTTDQTIQVQKVRKGSHELDLGDSEVYVPGYWIWADVGGREFFVPENREEAKQLLNQLSAKCRAGTMSWQYFYEIKDGWGDLRPSHACTVHKSQGSTYEKVFVDLRDIGKCFERETVARMLYVAFSRPRKQIYLYGNLPRWYGGY